MYVPVQEFIRERSANQTLMPLAARMCYVAINVFHLYLLPCHYARRKCLACTGGVVFVAILFFFL